MRHELSVNLARIDDFDEIVDVRSPAEYALDHIPGAVNCPVLDDEERARVGTIYKQVSSFTARKLGAALVARNVARHLETHFASRAPDWKPLVYCWRGGKRSESMAHILREIGWHAATLHGGYQSYRRDLLVQLDALPPRFDYCVVCGPTGSGKSRLLQALALQGAQVLDLEALAQHRGSVLGDLPGDPQPTQKMFDSRIWNALRHFEAGAPVFIEAESRKVGVLRVPTVLLECMRVSRCIQVEAPLPERVRFLTLEYRHLLSDTDWLKQKLLRLIGLHSRTTVERWMAQIDAAQWEMLVGDLLDTHYDPAYRRSMEHNYAGLSEAAPLSLPRLDPAAFEAAAKALMNRQGREAAVRP